MLQQAIGLSIILGFIVHGAAGAFYAAVWFPAGYLAFFLEQPYRVAVHAGAVTGGVRTDASSIGKAVILYGRRRFMLTVILGILLGWLYESHSYYHQRHFPGSAHHRLHHSRAAGQRHVQAGHVAHGADGAWSARC